MRDGVEVSQRKVLPKWWILMVLGSAFCIGLFLWVSEKQRSNRTGAQNGLVTDTHQINADAVESEMRGALPLGSALATVKDYLQKHRVEFSFVNPSRIVYAKVRGVKGGLVLVRQDVLFEFHFDDSLKLNSIDAKVAYTGP